MAAVVTIGIIILALILFIEGYRGSKKRGGLQQYFLMDGGLTLGPFVGTLAATNFSLGNMVFLSLIWGYFYGLSGAMWLWVGFIIAATVFILAVRRIPLVATYIEDKSNSGSVHEYLHYAYRDEDPAQAKNVRLAASLTTILCLLIALTLELYLASSIISPLVGVDVSTIFVGLTVLICLYSAMGGFYAVVVTDIVQGVSLILAVIFLGTAMYLYEASPIAYGSIYATDPVDFILAPGWTGILAILGVTAGWYLVTMDTWQRACASRSAKTAVTGMKWGTLMLLVGIVCFVAVGMYDALAIAPSLEGEALNQHSQGLNPITDLYLILDGIPHWAQALVGLAGVAFLMAGVSTADTFLIVCGHSLISDLMVGLGRGESFGDLDESESELLAGVGRAVVVAMAILVLIAFFTLQKLDLLANPLALFYLAYSIQFALLAPMIGTFLRRRTRPSMAFFALIIGIVLAVCWGFGFALSGQRGLTVVWGHMIEEWVYLAPLPPMIGGFLVLVLDRLLPRKAQND